VFGRATIRLGIGPHSSCICIVLSLAFVLSCVCQLVLKNYDDDHDDDDDDDELERKYVAVITTASKGTSKPKWMTNKVMKLVAKKICVYKKYKSSRHPACISINGKVSTAVKEAKRNFEKMLAKNIRSDRKSFFAYVRSKCKSNVRSGPLINEAGIIITDLKETANIFNEYFSSTFTTEDLSSVPSHISESSPTTHLTKINITEEMVKSKL